MFRFSFMAAILILLHTFSSRILWHLAIHAKWFFLKPLEPRVCAHASHSSRIVFLLVLFYGFLACFLPQFSSFGPSRIASFGRLSMSFLHFPVDHYMPEYFSISNRNSLARRWRAFASLSRFLSVSFLCLRPLANECDAKCGRT